MKKIFCLILAIIMILGLTACNMVRDTQNAQENESQTESKNDGTAEDSANNEPQLVLGEIKGEFYENEFIEIGFNKPGGWSFYNIQQLANLNDINMNNLDTDMVTALENKDNFCEMYAHSSDKKSSVCITMEKRSSEETVKSLDLSSYIGSVLDRDVRAYERKDYSKINASIKPIDVDGIEYTATRIIAESDGSKICEKTFLIKCGKYIAHIRVISNNENSVDNLIRKFYIIL